MDYSNAIGMSATEVAPRSEHHAAMIVLEDRASQLAKLIDVLAQRLAPALRPAEPKPTSDAEPKPKPVVEIVAHVDAVLRVVEGCIQRVESLDCRLAI